MYSLLISSTKEQKFQMHMTASFFLEQVSQEKSNTILKNFSSPINWKSITFQKSGSCSKSTERYHHFFPIIMIGYLFSHAFINFLIKLKTSKALTSLSFYLSAQLFIYLSIYFLYLYLFLFLHSSTFSLPFYSSTQRANSIFE